MRSTSTSTAPSPGQRLSTISCGLTRLAEADRVADEAQDELRSRRVIELGGRPDLLEVAVVHDRHPVGDLHRLLLVVRDEDRRHVHLLVQAAQPVAELRAHPGVEGAEGLVEEQDARLRGQRARQGHSLPLAARQP
jgi:hypothetical protein